MPSLVDLTDLYEYAITDLPGVEKPMLLQHVRSVVGDFTKRTKIWQCDLDSISIVADETDYDLDDPSNAQIIEPMQVLLYGAEIYPSSGYSMPERTVIRLANDPPADYTDGLDVKVALRLSRDATKFDADLMDEWYSTLAAGVKASLMAVPNSMWTNPQMQLHNERIYGIGVQQAIIKRNRMFTNSSLQATAPSWARW